MDDAIESPWRCRKTSSANGWTMSAAVEAYTVKDWAEEQLAGFPEVATVG